GGRPLDRFGQWSPVVLAWVRGADRYTHRSSPHRQLTNQSIVYSNPFYHVPVGGLEGDEAFNFSVECDYPRRGSVSFEKDLLPQQEDFSDLLEAVGSFNFSLTIMDEEWQQPRSSATFLLGGAVNLEARVQSVGGGHLPLRLFIDSCIATPGGGPQGGGQEGGQGGGGGDLEYALVEQHG
uniref:Zona pellucida sperm-binding protein 3-like n=1 Tax=Petromyzon marinus TaxID=7757 RepID=A0AAJ7WJR8_PETMA